MMHSSLKPVIAMAACGWVMVASAAIKWPGTESPAYTADRNRLERMKPDQRRQLWEKYQEFLTLPLAEQDRIRRLHADLEKQSPDKQARYRGLMDRYKKWKDTLPLYERQALDEAATQGPGVLYTAFRETEKRQEVENRKRAYWLLPEVPGVRKALPEILSKLTPEEVEELDQTSPLERTEKVFSFAQQQGLQVPAIPGSGRAWLRGPVPPPDDEEFRKFLQTLPRDQLEDLGDLGFMKAMRVRRQWELFYRKYPEKRAERMKQGDRPRDAMRSPDRPPPKEEGQPESRPLRSPAGKEVPKKSGKPGIPPPNP